MSKKIPADLLEMSEAQALAELNRLDSLAGTRTLTPVEFRRLTDTELRLEQFSVQYAQGGAPALQAALDEQARRRAAGLFAEEEAAVARMLATYKGPVEIVDVTLAARGSRVLLPLIIIAALLAYNKYGKKKKS